MKKAVPAIILAMFLAGAALQTARIVWDVGEKMELDYGEGLVLYQASEILHLKQAFRPLEQYPHVVVQYAPVYLVAVKIATGVLRNPLLSGRLISMTAAFWLVGLLPWTVFKATRGYAPVGVRWFSAVFTGACVLQVPTMQWVPYARVDVLGLALEFTALSIICVDPLRLRNQLLALLLLLLGLYTKQSLLSIPAASILLIGLIRPARAMWLACALLAAGLGILLALMWATDGGVIRHWVLYNITPFYFKDIVFMEFHVSPDLAALIAAGLAAFWLTFPRVSGSRRPQWRETVSARLARSPLRRTGVGFGLAATIGFFVSWGAGKEGAGISYCLDWQLAVCPLTGLFLVLLARNWTKQDRGMAFLRPLVALLLGATAIQLGVEALWDANYAIGLVGNTRRIRAEQRREENDLVKLISSFPGPVVSDNMVVLLRAGKSVALEPFIVKATTAAGTFDENPLIRRTAEKFFDAFILRANSTARLYSPRMLEAIRRNYQLYSFGNGTYLVYVRPHT